MKYRAAISIAAALVALASPAYGKEFGAWGTPVNAESIAGASSELNTPYNDGCPIQSPDGLSLYIASNRPGGLGGQDIWVAHRDEPGGPYGAPVHLGAPVNSAADDFCPSPARGRRLFFVSARSGGCGGPDIYVTRQDRDGDWRTPRNLGCTINSAAGEASPSLFKDDAGHAVLYFSSSRPGGFEAGGTDSDIYFSVDFGAAQLAPGLNTADEDSRPNVRKDGLEVVFDSTRAGGFGGPDIWTATRSNDRAAWGTPVNLGATINTAATESRASLSWDARTMVFGSNRVGSEPDPNGGPTMADVYVTTRQAG
jgi:Tol biopolymer transport system component